MTEDMERVLAALDVVLADLPGDSVIGVEASRVMHIDVVVLTQLVQVLMEESIDLATKQPVANGLPAEANAGPVLTVLALMLGHQLGIGEGIKLARMHAA